MANRKKQFNNPKITYRECVVCGIDNVDVKFTAASNKCNDCAYVDQKPYYNDWKKRKKAGEEMKSGRRSKKKDEQEKEEE